MKVLAHTKIISTIIMFLLLINSGFGQITTQTVRGVILDADSQTPLIGAEIILIGSNPIIGTVTDENGKFRLENMLLGRYSFQISYLGYETKTIPNVVVNSAKENILNIELIESVLQMEEVVVLANQEKGTALNDMAIIGGRSISPEQTNRYAGGFNDPSRIMSNFAGVTNTQDGGNDIIVRGNSPKYIQWRLEGIQITNPNHFADQSSVGGSTSTLNNNLMATSDFYTGAFSAEYGDVLSGIYDVKLRAGNNEKVESVFGFGILGTDLTVEGPLKKGYGGSFLVNYRYSTVTLISELGLLDIQGVPKFQDAAFKVVLPSQKLGRFSIFGLAGKSTLDFKDITPAFWVTPGDNFMQADIKEDMEKESYLLNTGINHTLSLSTNSFLKTTLSYSNEGIDDEIFESKFIKIYDETDLFLRDSIVSRTGNYKGDLSKSTFRTAITYNNKINAKNKIQIGTKYASTNLDNKQSQFLNSEEDRVTLVDFDETIGTLRNFVSWKHRFNEDITMVTGIHNMNVLYNNKSTIEPRFAVNWKLNNKGKLSFGYGMHSNMESPHNYFSQIADENGNITEPNKDLGLLKAHHFVLGYEKRFGKNMRGKVEAYYQNLYNLPVENNPNSYYSTINEGLEFNYVDLVNEGTGKNYGIEFTVERFFNNNYYFLVNASLYESKYTALDGIERNTQYNGNYLFNVLVGKEFVGLGKKNNQTLGLNAKLFYGGGKKIIPLLRDANGNLAVEPENNLFWDYSNAYENKIEDIYEVIVSASYKWNKPKTTHELFLNINNLTNSKGRSGEYYDANEEGEIGYVSQFGLFPNLMYRLYF